MSEPDVLCFSHLRWNFVYQRPNHLMTRIARERRVFFIEEAVEGAESDQLEVRQLEHNLLRVVPHVRPDTPERKRVALRRLVSTLCVPEREHAPLHWFYTPMMLPLAEGLPCSLTVYDCMDELANFLHAPAELRELEQRLLARADVVFTGGNALYRAKCSQHPNVHPMPSGVDARHFQQARSELPTPLDQAVIPRPRIGYCGVIDERIDIELLAEIAQQRPDWQLIMLGPHVKIDPARLPRHPNIHYLGLKSYAELPSYMSGWDAAILPFARNASTRFISPTKTPEYLAAGLRVVSTAIDDVVDPYERLGLVRVGRSTREFVSALAEALRVVPSSDEAEQRDAFLATCSWDSVWERMRCALQSVRGRRIREGTGKNSAARAGEHV
jgi:glycosyltransferase involved in cell wall biosynthesis